MTFQRYTDHIFNWLGFIFIFIDNILVASRDHQEHLLLLQEVLQWLQQAGLILNSGIHLLAAKVEALCRHPWLATVKNFSSSSAC